MLGRRRTEAQTPDAPEESAPVGGSTAVGSAEAAEAERRSRAATPGKGRPTPSRRQQEAARVRPLVPEDRKRAKEQDRAARRERRLTAQQGLAAGDARYLPPRDQGEQRAFVRDWVDSRWNVAELLMPVAIVALVFLLIPSGLQRIGMVIFYGLLLLALLDSILLVVGVRRAVDRRFDEREPGVGFYAVTRATNLRSTRMPRPRVRRGQRPA